MSKKQKTGPDKSTRNDDRGQKSEANKTKRPIQSKNAPFTNKSSAHTNTIPNQKAGELRKQTVQTHSKSDDNSKVPKQTLKWKDQKSHMQTNLKMQYIERKIKYHHVKTANLTNVRHLTI